MAEKQTIEMYRGDSKTITVNFGDNASMFDGGIVTLTLKTQKDNIACSDPLNHCVFQLSDTIVPVMNGAIITGYKGSLFIPPFNSRQFEITSYFYDIQAIGADDDPAHPGYPLVVKTLVEGKFKVTEDVTIRIP